MGTPSLFITDAKEWRAEYVVIRSIPKDSHTVFIRLFIRV